MKNNDDLNLWLILYETFFQSIDVLIYLHSNELQCFESWLITSNKRQLLVDYIKQPKE